VRTRVGYAGGTTAKPTYRSIGDHAESIQLDYDPRILSYEALLDVFWASHNPCSGGWTRQYMSAILVHDERQRALATASLAREQAKLAKPITTEILSADPFTRAEDYHQKYYLRQTPWLFLAVARQVGERDRFTDSTAAARLNAAAGGQLERARIEGELPGLGLPADVAAKLLAR